MCLHFINSDKIQNKIKDTIPEDSLKVYKVVEIKDGKYHPVFQHTGVPFEKGMNEAKTYSPVVPFQGGVYQAGFHFWLTKKTAKECRIFLSKKMLSKFAIIECEIKKEWITTIGTNAIHCFLTRRTIVTDRAIFPAFKEKD